MEEEKENEPEWASWSSIEDRQYRRYRLMDQVKWPPKVLEEWDQCLMSAGKCGGCFAMCGGFGWGIGLGIEIMSGSGAAQSTSGSIQLGTEVNRVLAIGWSLKDLLTVTQSDGRVTRIGVHGRILDSFTLESGIEVFDSSVAQNGQAIVRTVQGNLWCVGDHGGTQRATALSLEKSFLPPKLSTRSFNTMVAVNVTPESDEVVVFLSCFGGCVSKFASGKKAVVSVEGPVTHLTLSANGSLLAGCLSNGSVLVMTTQPFAIILRWNPPSEISYGSEAVIPRQIAWCGNDAVGALYDSQLVLFGPHGGHASWTVPLHTFMTTECDGVRLISKTCVDFIELVPGETENIFSLGSTHVASILFSSMEGNETEESMSLDSPVRGAAMRKHCAVELLTETGSIADAAECCAKAARREWSKTRQNALLRAASFGFSYADVFGQPAPSPSKKDKTLERKPVRDINLIPRIASTLRVLNAVRSTDPAVLITANELDEIGIQKLIKRVSAFGNHDLALKLCSYCDVDPAKPLARWFATYMKASRGSEEEIGQACIKKFQNFSGEFPWYQPPYVSAARSAVRQAKFHLAKQLLQMENDPSARVQLLLEMDQGAEALADAMRSHNFDLIWDVYQQVRKSNSVRSVVAKIRNGMENAIAVRAIGALLSLLQRAGMTQERLVLLEEAGRYRDAVIASLNQILENPEVGKRAQALESLATSIQDQPKYRSECGFEREAILKGAKVALTAADVERKLSFPRGTLISSSSSDIVSIVAAAVKSSEKRKELLQWIQRQLKVDDRRFVRVCVDALADEDDFDGLREFAKMKGNPPVTGYMPFVHACLRRRNFEEAGNYAHMIKNPHDRARALARCGLGKEAVELAVQTRNSQFLDEVQTILISASKQLTPSK